MKAVTKTGPLNSRMVRDKSDATTPLKAEERTAMGTLKQASKILSMFEDTPTEQVQAIIASGFLADLRDGNIAEVKRDDFRRLLGFKSFDLPLLEPIGTVKIAAIGHFVAREHFVRDTSRSARVKIALIGDNFASWFLEKIEEPTSGGTLKYGKLTRIALDDEIRKDIGVEHEETTLAQIWSLMKRQKDGKPGVLFTNGWANIFYVEDATGVLRAVLVRWYSHGDGWRVDADSVEGPDGWHDGLQVFSRNF